MDINKIVAWMTAHPFVAVKTICNGRKIGRNEKCPCGSGLKFKNCCIGGGEGLKLKYHRVNRKDKNNAMVNGK